MPMIETDVERLEQKLIKLKALRNRVLKSAEVEALAECAFRIAVHRSTQFGRAAELLQLAMRTDPANPKYPFHLARLYFRCGDFAHVGDWLNRARQQCPTSHRIWTHIGLLQREVNEINNRRYREQKDYTQDEHKQRWKDISEAIGKGSDKFPSDLARFEPKLSKKSASSEPDDKPAGSPTTDESENEVERITDAGVCRWTRIFDLITEDLLESDASSRARDAMRPLMERAAASADSRLGGRSLFCILAIEWVLRGYPPDFLRRIRPEARPESAADKLFDEVLRLIDEPVQTLPASLAAALEENRIPAVLAAAIHRQLVLGPPLDCGKLIADLRESRAIARNASPEDCAKWLRTLTEDATILEPKPFATVADFPAETVTRKASPQEILADCTRFLERTQEDVQRFRTWLDDRRSKGLDAHSQEEIWEANRIRSFVATGLSVAKQRALGDLKRLRDTGDVQAFADTIQHLENGWQNLNVRPLTVLSKRYPVVDVPVAKVPSAATAKDPDPATAAPVGPPTSLSAPPPQRSAQDSPTPPQDPKSRLAALMEELEQNLLGRFDAQLQTVAAYSRPHSFEPALQAVRMSIVARKAEALYRLGKRSEARREWAILLNQDIFDLRLLRNLAIGDTVEGDVQRYLSSWRNYVEMLYFQAVAMQDVTHLAAERETFHRNYGNAYGLRNLYEQKSNSEKPAPIDPNDLQTFLDSPARVRLYIRHQLLAVFNRRLSFRTAPLVLGVTRSASESAREEARQKMEAWSSASCRLLPARAANRFSTTVSQWLATASEVMKSNKRLRDLAGSKDYQEEQGKYLQWIADVFSWKIRLYTLLEKLPKFTGQPGFLDLLTEFADVDSIPLDTSEDLLQPVALQLGQRPEVICTLVERACLNSLLEALQFVFPKAGVGDSDTEPQRQALYTRLTEELASTRLVSKNGQIIDNPGNVDVLEFYPQRIQDAIRNGKAEPADIRFLERLHKQYPLSGGITFHYALVLAHSRNIAEAKEVAAKGVATAFHDSSRRDCKNLLDQIQQAGG